MAKKTAQSKSDTDAAALTGVMAAFNPMAPETWREIMTESARFLSERLQHDLEVQQAMLRCKTPMELFQVQTEFYQKAVADYAAEATRMMQITTTSAGAKRDYDDIPL